MQPAAAGPCATMCVKMSRTVAGTSRVGIRELRQNLSVYLRRLDGGERFEITDRGRPVALLVPLASSRSPLEKLVAQGRARMPARDLLDLPAPRGEPSTAASDALVADRDDRL